MKIDNIIFERSDILKLFYCYSPNLKNRLLSSGFSYLHSGVHRHTGKTFWVFEGTDTFNFALSKWKKNKI